MKTKTKTIRVTTTTDLKWLHAGLKGDIEFEFTSKAAARRLTAWIARREGLDPATVAV